MDGLKKYEKSRANPNNINKKPGAPLIQMNSPQVAKQLAESAVPKNKKSIRICKKSVKKGKSKPALRKKRQVVQSVRRESMVSGNAQVAPRNAINGKKKQSVGGKKPHNQLAAKNKGKSTGVAAKVSKAKNSAKRAAASKKPQQPQPQSESAVQMSQN